MTVRSRKGEMEGSAAKASELSGENAPFVEPSSAQTRADDDDPGMTPLLFLQRCISAASFWSPLQIGPQPAWLEHAPFAFWLVEALRPRTIVELGTHGGFSYFVFCQAVQSLALRTRCCAVDTWKGDDHAGYYGEEVFQQVREYNDARYSTFSNLLRCTFDDALAHFDNQTIDLLHIDGSHFYESVKRDFETWYPKLSERAVVLFHDTNVRERDFGVFRLWLELSSLHPHFEFVHADGLGILGVGEAIPAPLKTLFAATRSSSATEYIREAYLRLGSAVSLQLVNEQQSREINGHDDQVRSLRSKLEAEVEECRSLAQELSELRLKCSVQQSPPPRLTVYCVAYKRYDKIEVLVHSLMCQTYRDFRLVVVHDGEDPEMRRVLAGFKLAYPGRFDFFFTEKRFNDYGHSLRALAIEQCDSKFIMLTNDDNYYAPPFLEYMFNKIDMDDLDLALCDMVHSYEFSEQPSYNAFVTEPRKYRVDIGCLIVKTELAKAVGFRDKSVEGDGTFVDDIMNKSGREVKWGKVDKILFVHN